MRVQMVAHKSDKALKAEHQKCKILIMTSAQNHVETVMFFRSKKFFGYQESSFVFFQQAIILPLSLCWTFASEVNGAQKN